MTDTHKTTTLPKKDLTQLTPEDFTADVLKDMSLNQLSGLHVHAADQMVTMDHRAQNYGAFTGTIQTSSFGITLAGALALGGGAYLQREENYMNDPQNRAEKQQILTTRAEASCAQKVKQDMNDNFREYSAKLENGQSARLVLDTTQHHQNVQACVLQQVEDGMKQGATTSETEILHPFLMTGSGCLVGGVLLYAFNRQVQKRKKECTARKEAWSHVRDLARSYARQKDHSAPTGL